MLVTSQLLCNISKDVV